jgi:uncharacterized protein RhaS with RHS repeats
MTSAGSSTYCYDANGNQTTRVIGADTYTLKYDADRETPPQGKPPRGSEEERQCHCGVCHVTAMWYYIVWVW